jgi:glycosyltransferase involved in cell wall biosynthesis
MKRDFVKVLILAPQLLPISGGVGAYTVEIARRMPMDVELTIATLLERGSSLDYEQLVRDANFPKNVNLLFVDTPYKGRFASALSFQSSVRRICRDRVKKGEIDLVHTQSEMSDILLMPSKLGVPIVSTVHSTLRLHREALLKSGSRFGDMSQSERTVYLLGPAMDWFERAYYTNKRHYVAVSEWSRRRIMHDFGVDPTRVEVIHNGVDADLFNPSKKERCADWFPEIADIKTPKILFFSRLATRKGIGHLLKAIPKVVGRTDVHFILAGPGKLPSNDVPKHMMSVLGHVSHDIAPYLYADSDIFVLPSMNENFPISLLEAMASGCSVAATEVGGVPEVLTDRQNGRLFEPGNTEALVEVLVSLVEETDTRLDLARKGRQTVLDRFKWSDTASRTAEHYRRIVGAHTGR